MSRMRVVVVGGGVSGLTAAYALAKEGVEVVLYEKEHDLGGHAKTIVTDDGTKLDIGFMVFNRIASPNMMELFESLGVDLEPCDMSFSASLRDADGKGTCEWGTRNGFSSFFAQKKNILNPQFWKIVGEVNKFNDDALNYLEELEKNEGLDRDETMEDFVRSRGYSEFFQKAFLNPMCASICPRSSEVMSFSAYSVISSLRNLSALQVFGRPQWLIPRGHSCNYVDKIKKELELRGCQIETNIEIDSVSSNDEGCVVTMGKGLIEEVYDQCIIAGHAPDALKMLGKEVTSDERRILGAFKYAFSDIFLHHDKDLMPKNRAAWSSWNFLGTVNNRFYVTYWLNAIQNIDEGRLPFLLSISPPQEPEHTLLKWSTIYPIPTVAALKVSTEFNLIQGKRRIWFCGAYQGYGFHEDGVKAGLLAANSLLGKSYAVRENPKPMILSWQETGARLLVTRFLERFVATGYLILSEDRGAVFTFDGARKKSTFKVALRIHNPQFYWKVALESDLGFADAYIDGDFSFLDKNEGLLNFFLFFIANAELNTYSSKLKRKRGWWTPLLYTSIVASTKYSFKHFLRRNTLIGARRNISRHYDLSNELFSLFLDETMTYSCAVFENPGEDLKIAQLRKLHVLIQKAKVTQEHHVLDIGCGWGSLALEAVKRTGCKYTGITLSEKQLQYAKLKVKEAGLQDYINFIFCDYRELPKNSKYDRIISIGMFEAVGHEYMEEFFRCCDSALAENGRLVLQFASIEDEKYDENRLSSGFMKEYIFPGGCLPSLTRVTSAMAAVTRFSVEHVENTGRHYYHTLRCWRENFLRNQGKILALGFDQKFIRTWEYYFDYVAAGFKSRILGNYQIVFTRPGDVAAVFGNA